MRKQFWSVAVSVLMTATLVLSVSPVQAVESGSATPHVIGTTIDSPDVKGILAVVSELVTASNAHSLEGVLKNYSSRFVSGDNMSLDQVKNLIQETWAVFPDINYQTQTMEIRVSGDWATVESIDSAAASAKVDPVVGGQAGKLESRSRGLLYLHRIGNGWEILSDYTLYERALITYGQLGPVNLDLSTPEQVFAGEPYTARVNLEVPEGVLAIATISREPLVYPQVKPRDKFRSLSSDKNSLERIFSANKSNTNEVVTATVGFTQIAQDTEDRPTIQLNGIATIVKRVNILPRSQYKPESMDGLVKVSASGTVDLSKDKSALPDDEE